MAYELIETVEVGAGGASSIQFTSIPQTFTDLQMLVSLRDDRGIVGGGYSVNINGFNTNSSSIFLEGNGSSAVSGTTGLFFGNSSGANATTNTFSNAKIYIANYTSNTGKSISVDNVNENNATASFQQILSNLWDNNQAITSITFSISNFLEGSTVSLYGIS